MSITNTPFDFVDVCPQCGATPLSIALTIPQTEDSIASCAACGHELGRFGDVKAATLKKAEKSASSAANQAAIKKAAMKVAEAEAQKIFKGFKLGK